MGAELVPPIERRSAPAESCTPRRVSTPLLLMHWKFLIQKEGDRDWHSLQSSPLEIEEGNYRIVAHSNPNIEVEIRITHQLFQLPHSINYRQTYCRCTNSQGLLMIFPYTQLQAGMWEIRCHGDIMSELLGNTWQEIIQLRVLPNINSKNTSSEINPLTKILADLSKPSLEDYLVQLEHLLRHKIEPLLPVNPSNNLQNVLTLRQVDLFLDEDTWLRNQGESIVVSGQIENNENLEIVLFDGKIRYELRQSNAEDIIFTFEHTLVDEALPLEFQHILYIPDEPAIPLLIGEIIIETSGGEILAQLPFSISTHLNLTQSSAEGDPGCCFEQAQANNTYPIDNQDKHLTDNDESPSCDLFRTPVTYTIKLADTETNASSTFDLFLTEEMIGTVINLPEPKKMQKPLCLSSDTVSPILPPKLTAAVGTSVKKKPQLPPISSFC